MTHPVLAVIINDLNQHLQFKFGLEENLVALNNPNQVNADHIGVTATLVNLQKEGLNLSLSARPGVGSTRSTLLKAQLLMAAHHQDYSSALEYLDTVFSFFENKPIFTSQNTAGLPPNIQKISSEAQNLNWNDLGQLWSLFPGKHAPSLVYELRIIGFEEESGLDSLVLKDVSTMEEDQTL